MLRPVLAATAALALALAALVAPATIAPAAPASAAAASGSGLLFESGGSTCGPTITNPCRAAIEWRTNSYGPAGETQVKRRTMFSVYAVAGERILVGSSSMQTVSGSLADIVIWDPGLISESGVNTVANADLPLRSFSCQAQRASDSTRGVLDTRLKETSGPQAVSGGGNPAGYKPCSYIAPSTGIYRVAFYGTAGPLATGDGSPSPIVAPTTTFPNPSNSSAVNAWDITVRSSDASIVNIPGRMYTYSFAFFTGGNARPVTSSMYLNTTDGFRYRVDMRGLDGNGYVYYGNRSGFLDADGTPLNRNVVGTNNSPQTLAELVGGTHLAAPEYPLSLEKLAPETLLALGIPTTPTNPVLNSVSFAGKKTASGSYIDQGGTFTVDTGTSGTYEIVLSSTGTDFDPGLPANATIRGVVNAAGVYEVEWDGKDNAGDPFPIGNDYEVHATLRGGEYHAPMLDIESSYYGGPTITLVNPPSGICPFTGATSDGTNCTTAFYDDRGYTSSNGTDVGTPGGAICPNFAGEVSDPRFSDPVTGFDSAGGDRAFGTTLSSSNANAFCPTTNGTLGDAKGLDIWTFFPSAVQSTQADVLPLPTAPVAAADTDTTSVGVTLTRDASAGVLGNDAGSGIAVSSHTQPGTGTLTIDADGSYSYVPSSTATGVVTANYTITDDAGQTATATLTITVGPRANPDAISTPAETAVTVSQASLVDDDQGTSLTVTGASGAAHGSAVRNADGSVTYTPDDGFSGTDTFDYTIRDGGGRTGTGVVTVTVTPTAGDELLTVAAGGTGTLSQVQLTNDDLGTGLETTAVGLAAHGTTTRNADGSVSYVPTPGFSGDDSFSYTVTDDAGQTASATVYVTVTPTASDDTLVTTAEHDATITQAELIADDLGTGLEVTDIGNPSHGAAFLNPDGSVGYTPADGFSGIDSFNYTVTDDAGRTATATITVTVAPEAHGETLATTVDTPVAISHGDLTDDDLGTGLEVTAATDGQHGSTSVAGDGSITYTPDAGFSGTDAFVYTVTDDAGLTATATVSVTVSPTAGADQATTVIGEAVTLTETDLTDDDEGTDLRVTAVGTASHGTVVLNADRSVTYTPADGFSGTDGFSYTVTDASGLTTVGTVTVTVTPEAGADVLTTTAGNPAGLTETTLTDDDEGTDLRVTAVGTASHGTVVLNADRFVTYTPADGFSGTDGFSYTVTDASGLTATATVTVTVTPTAGDDAIVTAANTAVALAQDDLVNDDHGTGLEVTSVGAADHGSVILGADGAVHYTPGLDYSGPDTFTYTVTDDAGQTASAVVHVTVTPTAGDDALTTAAETSATITYAQLTDDDAGADLDVTAVGTPSHGTAVLNADASITYTPADGFSGTDGFSYTVTDGASQTVSATVVVTVTPTAGGDTLTTAAESPATISEATLTDDDLGSALQVTAVGAATHGTVVLNADRSVTYTPADGFSGTDGFSYQITDGAAQTATATVVVTVTPTASGDTLTTPAGTTATLTQAQLTDDDLGTGLEVTSVGTASHGTVALHADGSVSYEPALGYSGPDSFGYTVTDDAGQQASSTVTVTVTPTAAADTLTTVVGDPVTITEAQLTDDDSGSGLKVTHVGDPAHGSTVLNADGSVTYTPTAGYSGFDTFNYTVTDDAGQTATATATVTVQPAGGDDIGTTPAGQPLDVAAPGVLANDSGTGLTITAVVDDAEHGTITLNGDGSYRYIPDAQFSGTDTFAYEASDGAAQSYTQTVTITVVPAAGDDTATTDEGTLVELPATELLDDDLGTSLEVTGATNGTHGTVTRAPDGTLSYTPEPGYSGQDTFSYTITGDGGSATATVTVLVRPVAPDDEIRTTRDESVDSASGRLLANARGAGLTVHGVTQPSHGTVVVDADGTFHYTPDAGYVGQDSFTYTLVDAFGTEATGTVSIAVVPQLPNTGADPRVWSLGALLALLAGLAFAAAARTRRHRMS